MDELTDWQTDGLSVCLLSFWSIMWLNGGHQEKWTNKSELFQIVFETLLCYE